MGGSRMKLLYVSLARTVWLFDAGLFNPKGLNLGALGVFRKLSERYGFAKVPQHQLDLNEEKALAFKAGTFENSKRVPVLISFSIYGNGMVAESFSSTDDSTEFLVDLSGWLGSEFGLAVPSEVNRGYVSQLDVESETPLLMLNPGLSKILRMIQERFKSFDGKPRQFDFGGISFWTEDITQFMAPVAFKFERKWKAPFSANQYFSQAPFETSVHLDLLNELERLLKA